MIRETENSAPTQYRNPQELEVLLEEIMDSAQVPAPPSTTQKLKAKLSKFPLFPLFLSLVFLGGIFLGTIFGFYWGKIKGAKPPFEIVDRGTEIIEPLQEQTREEKLTSPIMVALKILP